MHKWMETGLALALASSASVADDRERQPNVFVHTYSTLCIRHLGRLDALREVLSVLPQLPSDQAAPFTHGAPADAWRLPQANESVVVKLAKQKKHCAVYAARADKPFVKAQFEQLVGTAPPPLTAKRLLDVVHDTRIGPIHELVYEWSASHGARAVFGLAITESETADFQVLATAEIVPMTRERRGPWSGVGMWWRHEGNAPASRMNHAPGEEENDSLEKNFRR